MPRPHTRAPQACQADFLITFVAEILRANRPRDHPLHRPRESFCDSNLRTDSEIEVLPETEAIFVALPRLGEPLFYLEAARND